MLITVVADGRERSWNYTEPITVEQFLSEIEFVYDPVLDRINPALFTQIFDGIRITVVRVTEREYCEQIEIPFQTQTRFFEGLEPGAEQQAQAGSNGLQEICYRVRIEDGIEREPVEISRNVTLEAQDEIIYVGPARELEPVPIVGTLAYINNDNAWIMRGSSTTKRPLTVSSDLDPRVFSLSFDGRRLLLARKTSDDEGFDNQLWLINDTTVETGEMIELAPQDVLYAEWVPGSSDTISYSTGEPRQAPPGWQALNDLWLMRIDPETGDQINIQEVLQRSAGGLYGWWGTQYEWSLDGSRLAWIQADSIGLVDLDNQQLGSALASYAVVNPLGDWSWRTTVSWSPNSDLMLATVHGPPFGNEPPENSPIFNVAAISVTEDFVVDVVEQAGIWASPRYSPEISNSNSAFPQGYIAYLQARDWENSRSGEYDLVVADRDGSNARIIFPQAGQPGLKAQVGDLAWSPDGQQVALIYLGNLWIVDVETGIAHQLTQDEGASKPVWTS